MANTQELGSECQQCRVGAGSGGTAEGLNEGGIHLLSDGGQYAGLQSHMGCCGGVILFGWGWWRADSKFLSRKT